MGNVCSSFIPAYTFFLLHLMPYEFYFALSLRTDIIFFAIFRVACNMHQRFTLHAVRVLFCCLRTSFSRLSELSDRMIGERSQHAPTQTYCRSSSWFISDGPGFGPASAFHGT